MGRVKTFNNNRLLIGLYAICQCRPSQQTIWQREWRPLDLLILRGFSLVNSAIIILLEILDFQLKQVTCNPTNRDADLYRNGIMKLKQSSEL